MTTETTIGAIAIALIGVITKIWTDSTKQTDKVIDVVKQNAVAMLSLDASVKENTRVTESVGKSTKALTLVNKSLADKIGNVVRGRN